MVIMLAICLSGQVFADLTISPGDIVINTSTGKLQYTYQLTYSDMESGSTKFADDVYSVSDAGPAQFMGGIHAVAPTTGGDAASFILKFDLSSLQLYGQDAYIERVEVTDKIYLANDLLRTENSTIATSWSTGGSHYNTINTASTPAKGLLEQAGSADVDLTGQNSRTFYYRTVFTNAAADTNGFNEGMTLWNRCDSASTDYFRVVITIGFNGSPSGTYAGGDGSAGAPYQIATAAQLDAIADYPGDWDKHFVLVNDIDMSGYVYDAALIAPNNNTTGDYAGIPFSGHFDGNGCTIRNLKFFCPGNPRSDYVGLFGNVTGGQITNLVLADGLITGNMNTMEYIGLLAGRLNSAEAIDCHVSGTVSGTSNVGGLCGLSYGSTITNCSSRGIINATGNSVGGVIGYLAYSTATGCAFEGMLNYLGSTNPYMYGGVCGQALRYTMSQCSANVLIHLGETFAQHIGGLVGMAYYMTIEDCYAQGAIIGIVHNHNVIGGLSGFAQNAHVARSYGACRLVNLLGADDGLVAGFAGRGTTSSGVTFADCFWDTAVSGTTNGVGQPEDPDPAGILGLPTSMMKLRANFTASGWDFTGETVNGTADIWAIRDNETYPMHTGQCVNRPAGDINGDCVVDMLDVAQLSQTWLADDRIQ
jgi:hypothetical protein